ncbi:MAG TPA: MobF family relaxase [Acidimicrobiales bacterium]|nr:MobF family relaxase [Acidimicrobiales bacterium]
MTRLTNAEYLISSVALSIDEYYAGVGESPGVWAGRWSEKLGLAGVVEADELRAVVEGKHPVTGEDLLAGSRPRKVRAFDLTFSSPKSVSLLWALASEPVAEAVAAAHRDAVDATLGFLEEKASVARVQSQGVRRRVAAEGWVVARFTHRTSREGDPQLHSHCLLPNLVQRTTDSRHVGMDAGPLFEWARAAGSVYQNQLQRSLSLRLGVCWGPDHHNTREIEGFSRAQLRAFSKRSAQIEAELEAKGAWYESPALRMQADDEASLATRTGKDRSLTPSLLAGRWEIEARKVDLAVGAELEQAVCFGNPEVEGPGWEEIAQALVDSEVGLCAHSARFTQADVVEHICALSGGRLDLEEITAMADRFLISDLAVRLTPDDQPGRRRALQWSTAAHRATEDRTLALADTLSARTVPAISGGAVSEALQLEPGLGRDQVAAIMMLTDSGAGMRCVLAPAGYGKTTMLHTAAQAATGEGRPVVAVATTAKAVAELKGAGLDARTIARLRIDLTNGPLAAGTVVVLDEISQTPTREVEAVLAAVDACPGGSIWILGDPRQSQPVGAGGMADHIETLATSGRIPSAQLTVNRRQVDPTDRHALGLLRRGQATASQELRAENGWEHEHARPGEARQAMAFAVCDDVATYGAEQVAALVVSHTDAEDLADRIRASLADSAVIGGPIMTGPGWTTDRDYQAGDRILLHARCGPSGSRLVNGTTATVTRVEETGLTVLVDRDTEETVLPASFVQGTRKDGSPNLSHAWARTVDGAQGGTWEACHLLGSPALDAYRGYTGQTRSRQPTHTWNTKPLITIDYGGILADQRDPAEVVAEALARQPDPTLAARSDPWTLDRQLRDQIVEHDHVLAGRPTDPGEELAAAVEQLRPVEFRVEAMETLATGAARQLDDLGAFSGLSRRGREERRYLEDRLAADQQRAAAARQARDDIASRVQALECDQIAYDRFEKTEGWRREELQRLRDRLDDHWAQTVATCVRADDPLAFGIEKVRHARATTAARIDQLDASLPPDRTSEWKDARAQLPQVVRNRNDAEQALADSRARLDEASRRHWGRHDRDAIAAAQGRLAYHQQRLEEARTAEHDLRDRLAAIADYQQQRKQALNDSTPQRQELATGLAQFDAALDHIRPQRVHALVSDPPPDLVKRLGQPPESVAGRAVWCHHALPVEAALDRNDGISPPWTGWSQQTDRARREIKIADQHLKLVYEPGGINPAEWAELAQRAATISEQVVRDLRIRNTFEQTMTPAHQAEHHLGIDRSVGLRGPEIDL